MIVSQFRQLNLSVVNVRTYLFAVLLSEEICCFPNCAI